MERETEEEKEDKEIHTCTLTEVRKYDGKGGRERKQLIIQGKRWAETGRNTHTQQG